ncbi:MAG: glycerol-3-phosphate 1-O-acyltransferase PlsY [Clostridia bacterium]|nr:glycerol-3-phosphate 1-O-acyltransferase PlsY [Clostridia bacterium]
MTDIVTALLAVVFAFEGYLLGSVNAGVLVSKVFYRDDVRNHGSGNAGTTNMLRTFGKKAAALTLVIDFFKGTLACALPCIIIYAAAADHHAGLICMMTAACGCVAGHNWPCYFGFKGGKGVLVSFSVMLFLAPLPALLALAAFIVTVAISRYVSLGSVIAAAVYPALVFFIGGWPENTKGLTTFFIVSICLASLLIIRHASNISRLAKGTESKLSFSKKASANENTDENGGEKEPEKASSSEQSDAPREND